MHNIIMFACAHPGKAVLYAVSGAVALYIAWVALASIVVFCFACYIHYSNSKRAYRLREWIVDRQFINDMVKKATPEMLAKYGGKKAYKEIVEHALFASKLARRVKELSEARKSA